ncbi:MAG: Wzz/FepE/Etk N-terminal domain-containing protein [Candidatus Eisenbacteria bacterium]
MDLQPVFAILWKHRSGILRAAFGAAALTLAITFVLPRWYRATAVLMPPEESDLLSNMAFAQRALTKFPAFGVLDDYFTPADTYKAILASRTVQEAIVDRFHLMSVYKLKSREKTVKELKGHVKVKLNPDGTIAISVEDRDKQRAADMANAYIGELDRFNMEKRNTRAKQTRRFLEARVAETDSLLRASERQLQRYQEGHGAIAPTSAEAVQAGAAADLMARKLMLEVRLGMLRQYLRPEHEQVRQVEGELAALTSQIAKVPALQNDLARLYRDAKIREQLLLLLTSELEQARIQESMDTPTLAVLDAAIPPERHARPRRLTLAAAAALCALVLSSAWYAARERDAAGA